MQSRNNRKREIHRNQTGDSSASDMGTKLSFKGSWKVLKKTFTGFNEDNVLKLSGALAYYTVFSMGPLLIVIISILGFFLGQEAVEGKVYGTLNSFMGSDAASQLQQIIRNAAVSDRGAFAATIGVITLVIGATTVFAEIQDSINTIWGIKPKPKRGWLRMIINRLLSFSVIISLGFILLVSLVVTTLIDGFSQGLQQQFPDVAITVFYIANYIISVAVISLIFAVIYKVLPDAKIQWKDVWPGSIAAAVLFLAGKFGVSFYISQTEVGSTFGAAGSLVILLLWTYFSAVVLYIGAEFTKAYSMVYGSEIHPAEYAVTTRKVEVEEENTSVQQKEQKKEQDNQDWQESTAG